MRALKFSGSGRPLRLSRMSMKSLRCVAASLVMHSAIAISSTCGSHTLLSKCLWKRVWFYASSLPSHTGELALMSPPGAEDPLNTRRAWEEAKAEKKRLV